MTVSPRGIRSPIPAGNLIGRSRGKGTGAASLVPITDIAQSLQATGAILPPGAPSPLMPIATHTILANPTGSTAAPIATTTPNSSSITWAYGATTLTASISATYAGQTSITTLGTIGTGTWQGTKVGLAYGGTNADLSATGGTSQVLKQVSTGAAVTVGQLAASDLSNGTTGSGHVVLDNTPTLITPIIGAATGTSLDLSGFLTLDPASKPAGRAGSPTFYGESAVGFNVFLGTTGGTATIDLRSVPGGGAHMPFPAQPGL